MARPCCLTPHALLGCVTSAPCRTRLKQTTAHTPHHPTLQALFLLLSIVFFLLAGGVANLHAHKVGLRAAVECLVRPPLSIARSHSSSLCNGHALILCLLFVPQAAGWIGLVVSAIAFYIAAAELLNELYNKVGASLPLRKGRRHCIVLDQAGISSEHHHPCAFSLLHFALDPPLPCRRCCRWGCATRAPRSCPASAALWALCRCWGPCTCGALA